MHFEIMFRYYSDAMDSCELFNSYGAMCTNPTLCTRTQFWVIWAECPDYVPDHIKGIVTWH